MKLGKGPDAIPLVASSTQRDAYYPAPATNQRVQNLETGLIERYDGTNWVGTNASGPGVFDVVRDYSAVGDGTTDDTAAIQNAATAATGGVLQFPAGKSFKVTDAITLPSGTRVVATGATITQATADTEIFNVEGKSDVTIDGGHFVGTGNYTNSDSSREVAVFGGTSGARIHVLNARFTNFGYTPARFVAQDDCSFVGNTVVGPSDELTPETDGRNYGVIFDVGCTGALVAANDISGTAQGVRIEGTTDARIVNNRLHDIVGQHGVYAGGSLDGLAIIGNVVRNTALVGIKVQASNATGDLVGVTIAGNVVIDAGEDAILVCSGDHPSATTHVRSVTIAGNTIRTPDAHGLNLNTIIGGVVVGNLIETPGIYGIQISGTDSLRIAENVLHGTVKSAIRESSVANTRVAIEHNQILDCASSATAVDRFGIYRTLSGSGGWVVRDNVIRDANAKMEYGVFFEDGDQSADVVTGNVVTGTTGTSARFKSGGVAMLAYHSNVFADAVTNDPPPASVASATTITLPTAAHFVEITGTTGISTINTIGHSGHVVSLRFAGSLTVTNAGGNVHLAGAASFSATADDVLTLVCNNSAWYEVSRSVN